MRHSTAQTMSSALPIGNNSIDQEYEERQPDESKPYFSRSRVIAFFTILFRSLGLQLLSAFWFLKAPLEPAKVAIHRSRRITTVRLIIHALPATICIALIVLNIKQVLVKQSRWFPLLQFAAKFHEIFMQSSIAAILMYFVRYQLTVQKAAPFGALFSGIQVSNIAYLWSLEFIGSVMAPWMVKGKRLMFALVIISTFLLAASVGPSSAILMVPRPATLTLLTENVQLFSTSPILPMKVDFKTYPNPTFNKFPFFNTENVISQLDNLTLSTYTYPLLLGSAVEPASTFLHAARPIQIVAQYVSRPQNLPEYADSRNFEKFTQLIDGDSAGDLQVSVAGMVASVASNCGPVVSIMGTNRTSIEFITPDNKTFGDIITLEEISKEWAGNASSQLILRPAPSSLADQVSLFAIIVVQVKSDINAFPCVFKASWVSAITTGAYVPTGWQLNWRLEKHDIPALDGDTTKPSNGFGYINQIGNPFEWPDKPIAIEPEWVEHVWFNSADDILTAPEIIANYTDYYWGLANEPGSTEAFQSFQWKYINLYTQLLSGVIASGMSTLACIDGCPSSVLPYRSQQEPEQEQITWRLSQQGFGYTMNTWPSILAATVLSLYCIIIIGYVMISLGAKTSSNSWDSAAELTALALYSKAPPERLGYMSSGLETVNLYKESVTIMENEKENLELVFRKGTKDRPAEGYRELQYNKWY